jgi:hypothetical protein
MLLIKLGQPFEFRIGESAKLSDNFSITLVATPSLKQLDRENWRYAKRPSADFKVIQKGEESLFTLQPPPHNYALLGDYLFLLIWERGDHVRCNFFYAPVKPEQAASMAIEAVENDGYLRRTIKSPSDIRTHWRDGHWKVDVYGTTIKPPFNRTRQTVYIDASSGEVTHLVPKRNSKQN